MGDGTRHHPEEERLWGNMLHIQIYKHIGEALVRGTHSSPWAQWSHPILSGPLLYNPFRLG